MKHNSTFEQLSEIHSRGNSAVIQERSTKNKGIAAVTRTGEPYLFYGNADGSDDGPVSVEEFNRRFEIIGEED